MQTSAPAKYRVCPVCRASVKLEQPLCPKCNYDFAAKKRAAPSGFVSGPVLQGLKWGVSVLLVLGLARLGWMLLRSDKPHARDPAPAPAVQPAAIDPAVERTPGEPDPPALPAELEEFLGGYGLTEIDERDAAGMTPLHLAVVADRPEIMTLLLEAGAAPAVADSQGRTPLDLAVLRRRRACFDLLQQSRPSMDASAFNGDGLLQLAAQSGFVEIMPILIDAGAHPAHSDAAGNTPLHTALSNSQLAAAQWLLTNGAPARAVNHDGVRALHIAARKGFTGMVEALLRMGNEVDAPNAAGMTPLHLALCGGHSATAAALLEAGAPSDVGEMHGVTPMHMAAYGHAADVLPAMLAAVTNVNVMDNTGYTPMDYAMVNDNKTTGVLLQKAGGRLTIGVRAACEHCAGSRTCTVCRGFKRVRCVRCKGTGSGTQQSTRQRCRRCNGSGTVPGISGATMPCSNCRGAGTVAVSRTDACRDCSGQGSVDCDNCAGSGVCPHCTDASRQAALGAQKALAAEKIRAVLQSMCP